MKGVFACEQGGCSSEAPRASNHSCLSSATVRPSSRTWCSQTTATVMVFTPAHLHLSWESCALVPTPSNAPQAKLCSLLSILLCYTPHGSVCPYAHSDQEGSDVMLFSVLALMGTLFKMTILRPGKHQKAVTLTGRPLQAQHIKWVTTGVISVTQHHCACPSSSSPLMSLECKLSETKTRGNKIRMRSGDGKGKRPRVLLVWR